MQNSICPFRVWPYFFLHSSLHQHVYSITVEPIIHRLMRFEDTLFTVRTIIWSGIGKIGLNWSGRLGLSFFRIRLSGFICAIVTCLLRQCQIFFPARPDILDKHCQLCFCSMLYSYHHFFIKFVSFCICTVILASAIV
jgi:hypothetical protein